MGRISLIPVDFSVLETEPLTKNQLKLVIALLQRVDSKSKIKYNVPKFTDFLKTFLK